MFVSGRPAVFLGSGEAEWKSKLRTDAPRGLVNPRLHFYVLSWKRFGQRFDLDNLSSVVLDAVAAPTVESVWATIELSDVEGVQISEYQPPQPPEDATILHIHDPPTRSERRDQPHSELAGFQQIGTEEPLGLHLRYLDATARVGDLKFEGPVKPTIDTLGPVVGLNSRNEPEDWRFRDLRIVRESGTGGVVISVWRLPVDPVVTTPTR